MGVYKSRVTWESTLSFLCPFARHLAFIQPYIPKIKKFSFEFVEYCPGRQANRGTLPLFLNGLELASWLKDAVPVSKERPSVSCLTLSFSLSSYHSYPQASSFIVFD